MSIIIRSTDSKSYEIKKDLASHYSPMLKSMIQESDEKEFQIAISSKYLDSIIGYMNHHGMEKESEPPACPIAANATIEKMYDAWDCKLITDLQKQEPGMIGISEAVCLLKMDKMKTKIAAAIALHFRNMYSFEKNVDTLIEDFKRLDIKTKQ